MRETFQIDFYMSLEPECSFLREDGMELRLVPVDRACGSSYYVLIGVESGECSFVNPDPFLGSGGQALFIYFVDNEVGYLAKSYSGGSLGELFVTEDGGKSFQNVNIEEPQVKFSDHTSYCPFVMPEEMYQQDNEIYLVMGQGPDGDYHGEAGYSCGVYDAEGKKTETFDGSISARGARKAADFVKFCDAFDIPVLTLTNATGFMATLCSEKMMAKSVGELVAAFADATVPKVNVIIGKAYGTAYVAMNSKSIGADLVYAWDNAEIGMMDASLAAKIMYADADAAELNEKAAQYRELQNGVASAAARGYVDTVISPADTRKYVIGAFEMLFTKRMTRLHLQK